MSLTRYQIPNLLGGVSQEPDTAQKPNQCARMDDWHASPVDGLTRRPPMEHRFRADAASVSGIAQWNAFTHWILGADLENSYVLLVTNGSVGQPQDDLFIFRLSDGARVPIQSTATSATAAANYIRVGAQNKRLRGATLGDSTIILDTGRVPLMSTDPTDVHDALNPGDNVLRSKSARRAFYWVRSGAYLRTYAVRVWTEDDEGVADPLQTTQAQRDAATARLYTHDGTFGTSRNGTATSQPPYVAGTDETGFQTASIKPEEVCEALYSHPDRTGTAGADYPGGINQVYNDQRSLSSALETIIQTTTKVFDHLANPTYQGQYLNSANRTGAVMALNLNRIVVSSAVQWREKIYIEIDSSSTGDIVAFTDVVQTPADLPSYGVLGHTVKVLGDPDNDYDTYYLEFEPNPPYAGSLASESNVVPGTWKESRKSLSVFALDRTTMPAEIKRVASTAPGNVGGFVFEVQQPEWANRIVGDETTNPDPAFIGETIKDIFYHRGRLGFLLADQVVLSGVDDFFNFWKTTQLQILDSDPITVLAAHARSSPLLAAGDVAGGLVLLGASSQFILQGEPLLTPTSASVQLITQLSAVNARPASTQSSLMFAGKSGNSSFSRIYELGLRQGTELQYEAIDRTLHVPAYIPGNVLEMEASQAESLLAVRTDDPDEDGAIWIFRWVDTPDGRALNSWYRFRIGGLGQATATRPWVRVIGMTWIDSTLWLAVFRHPEDHISFERIRFDTENDAYPFSPNDPTIAANTTGTPAMGTAEAHYRTHLDRILTDADTVIARDLGTSRLYFDLPYEVSTGPGGMSDFGIVTRINSLPAGQTPVPPGRIYLVDEVETINFKSRVWVSDPGWTLWNLLNPTTGEQTIRLFLGEKYASEYEFAKLTLAGRDERGVEKRIIQGRTQLLRMKLAYKDTGFLKATVGPRVNPAGTALIHRNTFQYTLEPWELGVLGSELNSPNIRNGVLEVGIMSRPEWVTVELVTDSLFPASVDSVEIEANYEARGQSVRA